MTEFGFVGELPAETEISCTHQRFASLGSSYCVPYTSRFLRREPELLHRLIVVPQADVAFVSRPSVVRSSWLSTEAFL